MKEIRDTGHWTLPYWKQRMSSKEWRKILLEGKDRIIYMGRSINLMGKHVGMGIYEIRKDPKQMKERYPDTWCLNK